MANPAVAQLTIWGMVMDAWGQRTITNLGAELERWRKRRGMSYRELAERAHCNHSLLWKIVKGKATLTREVAEACDAALDAKGALITTWLAAQGSVRPAQLPAAPQMVGRDAELAALTARVNDKVRGAPVVVAIDGPAGVGKTALALRLAHQLADQYVDGQLYVDLQGYGPPGQRVTADTALEDFLSAMGTSVIPDTTRKRASLYRSLLAERKILVVLDNAADVSDVEPLLPASAECAIVVTSRRTLSGLVGHLGATRVTVKPLSEQDSITLIRQVIGEHRADAEATSVARLARLCGYLPLALRVAAEQLATYPHRSVSDLVDDLIEEEHRLDALEMADLASVFSWSYHTLGPDAARLFRLMGLHLGPHLSVSALAALAGMTPPRARRLLHRLASVHLVEIDSDDVVRLHDLIHAYARELVTDEETDEQRVDAAQRLVSWYVDTVREACRHLAPPAVASTKRPALVQGVEPLIFTDDAEASAWCDAEKENFGPIATLALQYGPTGAAHHLAVGLEDIGVLGHADQGTPGLPDGAPVGFTGDGRRDRPRESADDDLPQHEHASREATGIARRWQGQTRPWWVSDWDDSRWSMCRFGGPWGYSGHIDVVLKAVEEFLSVPDEDGPTGSADPVPEPRAESSWATAATTGGSAAGRAAACHRPVRATSAADLSWSTPSHEP